MLIRVDLVEINEGRREINPDKVKELADSIKQIGLINPITVKHNSINGYGNFILVAGMHRLEAIKSLGLEKCQANIIAGDNLKLELIEIDENLIRNELHYSEIDHLTARRKEIYEEMYPETKVGQFGNKGGKILEKTESDFSKPSFVTDTSNKTGKSETVIKESIYRDTHLIPEAKEVIKNENINKTEATELARQQPETQSKIVDLITTKQAKNYKEAKQTLSPEQEWLKKEYKQIDKEHDNHRLVANLINETKFLKIDEQAVEDYLNLVAVDCFKTEFIQNCDRLINKLNEMKAYHTNLNKIRRIK